MTRKKTVEFEEGWADELIADGTMTKEDVDALMRGIIELVATGEIYENATPVEDLPEEEQQEILESLRNKNTRH
jgi:hypothetical protein